MATWKPIGLYPDAMRTAGLLICMTALLALSGCASWRQAMQAQWASERGCGAPRAFVPAARANAASLGALSGSPFGRAETGWEVYAPAVAHEVGTRCGPASPGFAAALARWQGRQGLTAHGAMDAVTFEAMKTVWQNRRPFVAVRARGVCPDPPDEAKLATAVRRDSYKTAVVKMRPGAMHALHRMLAAARRAVAGSAADPDLLTAFSGYRSPAYDAERCEREGNCNGVVRATCSAHRTGLAVDLVVGAAPGFAVDSSADPSRLYQTHSAAYRWLLANAGRYGFVNYVFEPWHWEWIGQAP